MPKNSFDSFSSVNQSKSSKRSKYVEKPPLKLKGVTVYHCLRPLDALYRENLSPITRDEFLLSMKKVLMDLNALLYLSEDDFFDELEDSESLRLCLESCLVCLPKKAFCRISSNKQQQSELDINLDSESYQIYEKLYYIVLLVYVRISQTAVPTYREQIYNSWLLDVPKMLDLCLLFVALREDGTLSNLDLIRKVISDTIATNSADYSRDIKDFINLLYESRIPKVQEELSIAVDLTDRALKATESHFMDARRSFVISSNKIIFTTKDLFLSIWYFYLCFPEQFAQRLATDHEIQEDLIKIYVAFVDNVPQWKTDIHKPKFDLNFSDTCHKMCITFEKMFQIVHQLIETGDQPLNDLYSRSISTYCVLCLYLLKQSEESEEKLRHRPYTRLIHTLISRGRIARLYILQSAPEMQYIKLSEREKHAISFSHTYEQQMRQNQKEEAVKVLQKRLQEQGQQLKQIKKPQRIRSLHFGAVYERKQEQQQFQMNLSFDNSNKNYRRNPLGVTGKQVSVYEDESQMMEELRLAEHQYKPELENVFEPAFEEVETEQSSEKSLKPKVYIERPSQQSLMFRKKKRAEEISTSFSQRGETTTNNSSMGKQKITKSRIHKRNRNTNFLPNISGSEDSENEHHPRSNAQKDRKNQSHSIEQNTIADVSSIHARSKKPKNEESFSQLNQTEDDYSQQASVEVQNLLELIDSDSDGPIDSCSKQIATRSVEKQPPDSQNLSFSALSHQTNKNALQKQSIDKPSEDREPRESKVQVSAQSKPQQNSHQMVLDGIDLNGYSFVDQPQNTEIEQQTGAEPGRKKQCKGSESESKNPDPKSKQSQQESAQSDLSFF